VIDSADGQYLFHGTGMYCLASIIADNRLDEGAHWGKPGEPHGLRLSESFAAAAEFITYNAYYGEGGVLVLDRQKLAEDYELQAYVDTVGGESRDDEKEVVVLTPAITNLEKYLVAVVFDPAYIEKMCADDFFATAWSEGGWPASYSTDEIGAAAMTAALHRLCEHSLVNAVGTEADLPRHGNIGLSAPAPVI
jgi:hypothetical protein